MNKWQQDGATNSMIRLKSRHQLRYIQDYNTSRVWVCSSVNIYIINIYVSHLRFPIFSFKTMLIRNFIPKCFFPEFSTVILILQFLFVSSFVSVFQSASVFQFISVSLYVFVFQFVFASLFVLFNLCSIHSLLILTCNSDYHLSWSSLSITITTSEALLHKTRFVQ